MIDREEKFYNRFFVYVNQVFGEQQVRKTITKVFGLPSSTLKIIKGDSGTGEIWEHHVSMDIENKDIFCSVESGQQDIDSTDVACQSYSIYNAVVINREYILSRTKENAIYDFVEELEPLENITRYKKSSTRREKALKDNTAKIVALLLWLLKRKKVKDEIESLEFIRYKDEETGKYYVPGRGDILTNVVKKTSDTLKEWKDYGYKYFLRET